MEPNIEQEPQFQFNEEDWELLKMGLGELPTRIAIKLFDRMRKYEYDKMVWNNKQQNGTKGE